MPDPKVIAEIDGWRLTRWDYDNAPLVACKLRRLANIQSYGTDITVEFTDAGDLNVSWSGDDLYGGIPDVPAAVLDRLLADRDRRPGAAADPLVEAKRRLGMWLAEKPGRSHDLSEFNGAYWQCQLLEGVDYYEIREVAEACTGPTEADAINAALAKAGVP